MDEISRSLVPPHNLLPELKRVDNWICWDSHRDPRKSEPIPLDTNIYKGSIGEYQAQSYDDPEIRLSYSEACRRCRENDSISGIGFVVKDSPFCYIDLDDCVDPSKKAVDPEVKDLLDQLDSYTELSSSGTGLHVICRGSTPKEGWSHSSRDLDIEVYSKSWVRISEDHISPTPTHATRADNAIEYICRFYRIDVHDLK